MCIYSVSDKFYTERAKRSTSFFHSALHTSMKPTRIFVLAHFAEELLQQQPKSKYSVSFTNTWSVTDTSLAYSLRSKE